MSGNRTESRRLETDAAGFVLAGGRSIRMSRDKALVEFAGRPLVIHALSILREAGLPASIAGGSADLASFAPLVADAEAGLGPLSGICAALSAASARYAVFLSVDTPLLPSSLLGYLLHHARVTGHAITIPSVCGYSQTFPAVIDCAALSFLKEELAAGRLGCFAAFKAVAARLKQPLNCIPVELIVQTGQVVHPQGLAPFRWFLNLNTPADLARAESLAACEIA